ncbi:MAG: 20S proteasome subunit A/B [Paraglaciecola polaris]|uniref:20S proteasome subunit A/B n=1 Tax=Paraglaciecola polaris TaxID=222814 RepID=UPI003002B902|tara:strand:+ start:64201 stop:64944 length:744 start_codon:yes stop_codon:yes gene_type:complete
MTYCLAVSVDDGLVFASDSRTNAGVDYVATYSKMSRFVFENNRVLVLLTSGSLATSQAVVNGIKRDLNDPKADFDISQGQDLHEVAQYIGKLSQNEQRLHAQAIEKSNANNESSFILGGQIAGQACEIFLIYPQGNFISASAETPYLQIGESKYGKPILDRIISSDLSLSDAARCAVISLDSTMRSNVSVGPPLELALHKQGVFQAPEHLVLEGNSADYQSLQAYWNEGMKSAFNQLPKLDWDKYDL